MKMEFYAKINETENSEGWQVGHIELEMPDGESVWVDADEISYSLDEDGDYDVMYRGVYIMTDDDEDYDVDPVDFEGAKITEIYCDEDTDSDYSITPVSDPTFW